MSYQDFTRRQVLENLPTNPKDFLSLGFGDYTAEFINGCTVVHEPWSFGMITQWMRLQARFHSWCDLHGGAILSSKMIFRIGADYFAAAIPYYTPEQAAKFTVDTEIFPSPSLAVEFLTEEAQERVTKIKCSAYQQGGVKEYWIVDAIKGQVQQYVNSGVEFVLLKTHAFLGVLDCQVIPGFQLDLAKVFAK